MRVCLNILSCDAFLGLPFNIASVATLTVLLSKVTGRIPGEIIINLGDVHIYSNHIEQVDKQVKRYPLKFPQLEIEKNLQNIEDIESLEYEDFKLMNYHSYPSIKAKMAV